MTVHRAIRVLATAAMVFGVSACGGGGAGSASSTLPATGASQGSASATFVLKIPPKSSGTSARGSRAKYLTSAVQGISFSVTQAGNPLVYGYNFYALTPQSTYCTGGGTQALVCTLAVQAPPGADTFTVTTYDGTTAYAYIISTASITQTITAQSSNTINITTNGVVTILQLALDDPFPATGASSTTAVRAQAADADGNLIIGPFDMPLVLTDSDASGATSLSATSLAAPGALSLSYTGAALSGGATIQVEAQSPSSASNGGPFIASAGFFPGASGAYTQPSILYFGQPTAAAQTLTAVVAGPAQTVSVTTGAPSSGNACSGIVSVSGTSPSFTVTPVAAGSCNLVVSGTSGYQTTTPVLVSP